MIKKALLAAVAAVAIPAAAYASVTFDPATGTGFVGKGDVQLAFGWNNKAAQENAKAVTFSYRTSSKYEVVCEFFTGPVQNRTRHEITKKANTNINASVAYDARLKNQYTGYLLSGLGATTGNTEAPAVGETCPGGSAQGNIIEVSLLDSDGSGLFVTYGGNTEQLNWPTVTI